MSYREQLVTCRDGRVLEVATVGDPAGHTVFFHHGTPGSVRSVSSFGAVAESSDLFFVTMSRPGYANSSRREGRSVASVADDVRTALGALGRAEYISVGWSGGGPHALACAALDERCRGAWSLAGVVPMDADIDWTAGMGPENLEEFALAREGGPRYEAHMAETGDQLATANPDNIIDLFGGLLSEVDKAALADAEARTTFAAATRYAFAHGWRGFYDDDRAFFSPWGFDPATIAVPVEVWYGDEDLMVPPTHGAWLVKNLPTAREVHRPGEGHISLVTNCLGDLGASFSLAFA